MRAGPTIVLGAIAVLVAAGSLPARAQVGETPGLVTVTGESVIRRAPDVARIVFVAEARHRSPRQAQRDAALSMTAVQRRLREAGVGEDALRTLSYNLSPEYDFVENRQVLRGYVARNRLEVRVNQLDRIGELIDAAVEAGATSVEGLRFDLQDRPAAEREALRAASADAWARAQAVAAGVGRTVERVVRIEEPGIVTPGPVREIMTARTSTMQAEPGPPIVTGQVEVHARVTLTAELR
jgi:uncharacterized protein YggE